MGRRSPLIRWPMFHPTWSALAPSWYESSYKGFLYPAISWPVRCHASRECVLAADTRDDSPQVPAASLGKHRHSTHHASGYTDDGGSVRALQARTIHPVSVSPWLAT